MQEEFLHFIWLYQLFDHKDLRTTNNEIVQVYSSGIHNSNSGPDFSQSRIKIDNNTWAGNVEIHIKSSDWFAHRHQLDPAYSNVILHVVLKDDISSGDQQFNAIPTLELMGRLDLTKYNEWQKLQKTRAWIPCESFLKNVPLAVIYQMVHRSTVSRLERKVAEIVHQKNKLKGHWEFLLMQSITEAMGTKVNKEAFHFLAMILPFQLIKKLEDKVEFMAALLFGLAGLLKCDFRDDYPKMLKKRFDFLALKHDLVPLNNSIWKFMRMRPINFPSIRLAQLIAIFTNWTAVCDSVFYFQGIACLESNMRVEIDEYWKEHYRFDKKGKMRSLKMGKAMFNHIQINALSPFLYSFGIKHDDDTYCSKSLQLLEQSKAENNKVISGWAKLKVIARNGFESQGLIEMKNNYCSFKKCLSCKIGVWILNSR